MTTKASTNLLQVLENISNRFYPLPPTLENGLINLENEIENNLLQKLDIYVQGKLNSSLKKGGNKLAEQENQEFNLQSFRPQRNFRRQLEEFQDTPVTVEFCCGEFCKQASGCLTLIGCDFIELSGFNGEPVLINIICCDGVIEPEIPAFSITIPLERVASIESLTPPKKCPCPPPYGDPRGRPYNEEDDE